MTAWVCVELHARMCWHGSPCHLEFPSSGLSDTVRLWQGKGYPSIQAYAILEAGSVTHLSCRHSTLICKSRTVAAFDFRYSAVQSVGYDWLHLVLCD